MSAETTFAPVAVDAIWALRQRLSTAREDHAAALATLESMRTEHAEACKAAYIAEQPAPVAPDFVAMQLRADAIGSAAEHFENEIQLEHFRRDEIALATVLTQAKDVLATRDRRAVVAVGTALHSMRELVRLGFQTEGLRGFLSYNMEKALGQLNNGNGDPDFIPRKLTILRTQAGRLTPDGAERAVPAAREYPVPRDDIPEETAQAISTAFEALCHE